MIDTSSTSTPEVKLKYYILYGFSGGQAHSRKFRKLMADQGMEQASNILEADILIAHSAGSYFIPHLTHARLILLIGVPINHNVFKTYFRTNRANVSNFMRSHQLIEMFKVSIFSFFYLITKPILNFKLAQTVEHHPSTLPDGKQGKVVWIMNQHDPWGRIPELQKYIDGMPYSFISLHGSHDSLWANPEMFVAIISQYAKGLLGKTGKR